MAMRSSVMLGASTSSFSGRSIAFKSTVSSTPVRAAVVSVEAKRVCQLTGASSAVEKWLVALQLLD